MAERTAQRAKGDFTNLAILNKYEDAFDKKMAEETKLEVLTIRTAVESGDDSPIMAMQSISKKAIAVLGRENDEKALEAVSMCSPDRTAQKAAGDALYQIRLQQIRKP